LTAFSISARRLARKRSWVALASAPRIPAQASVLFSLSESTADDKFGASPGRKILSPHHLERSLRHAERLLVVSAPTQSLTGSRPMDYPLTATSQGRATAAVHNQRQSSSGQR